jgi:hypothetical protein
MKVRGQLHAMIDLPLAIRNPGTHWVRGWVGPIAGLNALENSNTFATFNLLKSSGNFTYHQV